MLLEEQVVQTCDPEEELVRLGPHTTRIRLKVLSRLGQHIARWTAESEAL